MIEETISLKDLVTGPAKEMLEGVLKLGEGWERLRAAAKGKGGGLTGAISGLSDLASGAGMVIGPMMEAGEKILDIGLEMGEMALESVEAKDALLATFGALGGGPAAGQATLDMLDSLSGALPQTRDQLAATTKQFMAMGVTDLGQLKSQLTTVASATAIMGESGGAAYTMLSKKVQEAVAAHSKLKLSAADLGKKLDATGANVNDVAKAMGMSTADFAAQMRAGAIDAGKFGDALQSALQEKGAGAIDVANESLGTLKAKFSENIGKLFEGVDIEPLMGPLKDLASIFSTSNASGQAMRGGLTTAFSAIFKVAGKVVTFLRHFFLDLVIWGLKGYIALKPMIKVAQEMNARFGILGKVFTFLKASFMVVAAVISVVVVVIGTLISAVVGVGVALMAGVGAILDFASQAWDALSGWAKSGVQMASDFIDGLIGGIVAGVGRAVDAVKGLGSSVLDGVKGVLGIHSPSIELMKVGGHVAGGFAAGIDGGAGAVGGAAQAMARAANDNAISPTAYQGIAGAAGSSGAAGAPAVSGGGGASVTVMPGAIVINGAGRDAESITEEAVSLIFERVALAQGA